MGTRLTSSPSCQSQYCRHSPAIIRLSTILKQIHNRSGNLNRATDLSNKEKHPLEEGAVEQTIFQHLKNILCSYAVLAHFDPKEQISISCDSSEVGLGVVLFQHYTGSTERPIANASKTLTDTQRCYSQVQ